MPSLKPVKKENLSVKVYNEIRNALINGQYEPGERLIIGELAQEMGVSITPVREAIFRLISEQGLEMQAATAVYVPYVNSEKLREIQQIRFHLEGMGAAEAARNITRKQLDNLIALQKDFISCTSTDPKRASYLNRKFHFGSPGSQQQAHPAQHRGIVLGHHRPDPQGVPHQDRRARLLPGRTPPRGGAGRAGGARPGSRHQGDPGRPGGGAARS